MPPRTCPCHRQSSAYRRRPAVCGVLDPQSTAAWHPLSQQELADKAMQLAQQMAAARASLSRTNGEMPPALISTAPRPAVSLDSGPSVASSGRADGASDLRVTPQE